METRARYVLIGIFTVIVIAAVFAFVFWMNYSGGLSQRTAYRIQFSAPVSGLMPGSSVTFNGINVGEVTAVGLASDKPRSVDVQDEENRPRGGVIVIHDTTRVRKILSTKSGRIVPDSAEGVPPLEELCNRHHASWGLSAKFGALDEVMERFGERARRHDDLTQQIVTLVSIVRDMIDEGQIESWPRRLKGVPLPTASMID